MAVSTRLLAGSMPPISFDDDVDIRPVDDQRCVIGRTGMLSPT